MEVFGELNTLELAAPSGYGDVGDDGWENVKGDGAAPAEPFELVWK